MADGLDLSEIVRRTVQTNAKFYNAWMGLSLDYFRGIVEIFGGTPEVSAAVGESDAEADQGVGALVLEGEEGTKVKGAFLVTNDLGRTVSCEFVASEFRDPAGARVAVKPAFDPATLELGPGEQRVVTVVVPIEGTLAAGAGYSGEFGVRGMDGFAVPVVLRRQHRVDDSVDGEVPTEEAPAADVTTVPRSNAGKAGVKKAGTKTAARKARARARKRG